jgi:hypothetical protein
MKVGFWTPENKLVGTLMIDDKVKSTGLGRLFEKFAFKNSSIEHDGTIEETRVVSIEARRDSYDRIEELAKLARVTVKTDA